MSQIRFARFVTVWCTRSAIFRFGVTMSIIRGGYRCTNTICIRAGQQFLVLKAKVAVTIAVTIHKVILDVSVCCLFDWHVQLSGALVFSYHALTRLGEVRRIGTLVKKLWR